MEIHAHMGPNVSIKKEDTSVFVQMEWLEIHIKEDVLRTLRIDKVSVSATTIVLILWLVYKEHVLVRAKVYFADKMLIANQKDMQLGVDVALDLLKMKVANVYHVRLSIHSSNNTKNIYF